LKYYPSKEDNMWNRENIYAMGYTQGLGLSVGSGMRTLNPHDITLDNYCEADIKASADDIPEPDNKFDYVYASHVLEHCVDVIKTLKEWVRVVKVGGQIIIIGPDCRYTPNKSSLYSDPQHKYDWQYEDIREICKLLTSCQQVNKNVEAHPQFSYLIVLRKTK